MSLKEAINQILNTSACDENHEGITCDHCGTFIPKHRVKISILNIDRWVQPVCKCMKEIEHNRIREMENFQKRADIERLFSISNLGDKFTQSTLENFQHREGTEHAFKATRKYIEEYPNWKQDGLLIWGAYGNGKSHLAAAVTNVLNNKGYIVVFQSVPELLERIKSTFNNDNKETKQQIMKALLECDLLVLDDIGAEKLTDWVQEVMFNIIDGRYRKKLPIFYTSNLKPVELSIQIGPRSYDRLVETSLTIENKATSFRREIAKERLQNYLEENK
ncbi:ATP-binding protein [Bacillus sp. UNCCL81]|uniref:ATP-binding protein n=1 Tax=Bacillus sp. UNCCL81 TaxID=1502755 RepID=UPI0008E0A53F|nr:ATP-binding protein [Bacillus sp. UNCCL81]SFC52830.1 DNA replication protein DnaC [Bacillus sp. UNCCL81]